MLNTSKSLPAVKPINSNNSQLLAVADTNLKSTKSTNNISNNTSTYTTPRSSRNGVSSIQLCNLSDKAQYIKDVMKQKKNEKKHKAKEEQVNVDLSSSVFGKLDDTILLIRWGPDWCLGIEIVDMQHRRLVKMLNELNQNIQCKGARWIFGKILDDLYAYTGYHFTCEEKMMKKYNYPTSVEHATIHEAFVGKVVALKKSFDACECEIGPDLCSFLKDWLAHHVQNSDRKLCAFLKMKQEEEKALEEAEKSNA